MNGSTNSNIGGIVYQISGGFFVGIVVSQTNFLNQVEGCIAGGICLGGEGDGCDGTRIQGPGVALLVQGKDIEMGAIFVRLRNAEIGEGGGFTGCGSGKLQQLGIVVNPILEAEHIGQSLVNAQGQGDGFAGGDGFLICA